MSANPSIASASRRKFVSGVWASLAWPVGIADPALFLGLAVSSTSSARASANGAPTVIDGAAHGIKANGHDVDDDALDRAIAASLDAVRRQQTSLSTNQYFRGGVTLRLPPGVIRLMRGHMIRSGHITVAGEGSEATVLLKAGGDFGDLLEIRDPKESNNTGGGGFVGLSAIDLGPTSGGALLRLSGCGRASSRDIATHNGFLGLQLDGVTDYVVSNVRCTGDRYFGQTPAQTARGEQGSAKPGSAFICLTSTNGVQNGNVEINNVTATGEGPAARFHSAAIRVETADVLLIRGAELGSVVDADLLVEVAGSRSVQALQTSNVEFDDASDYGLKIVGTTRGAVGDWIIEGRFYGQEQSHVLLDCSALAGVTLKVEGTGSKRSPIVVAAGRDISIVAPVLRGFALAATRPRELSGIEIRGNTVGVTGGILMPYAPRALSYAVRLDDHVVGCVVDGTVSAPGAGAYAGVRCRDLVRNKIANNLVVGGLPEVGTT